MTGEEVFSPLVTYIVGFLFALAYLGEISLDSPSSLIGRMILIVLLFYYYCENKNTSNTLHTQLNLFQ